MAQLFRCKVELSKVRSASKPLALAKGFRYPLPPRFLPRLLLAHGLRSPRGRGAPRGGGSFPVDGKEEELPEKLEAEEAEQEDREIAAQEEEAEASDEEAPLRAAGRRRGPPPRGHAHDVHILSCGFLLIFSAYGAAQNLESTVNTADNLGTISLGILHVSFTSFSSVASLALANLKPSWYTMVPACLYLGFAASIIWVGQGTYLTSTARIHAKDRSLHEGTIIGAFNGEFWGMFAIHQVVGNLVSLAVLREETDGSASGTKLLFIVFLCRLQQAFVWYFTFFSGLVGLLSIALYVNK
ncbi:hypothetical protein NL676_034363 [Syzygium grande]|nr:hypothetical protein NL676_034363 [Syzygium grande]